MQEDNIVEDGLVENLLAALADALRRTRKDPFGSPVTVAEIYQDLIPYRSVRTALGFQMNADYEHTVLRMLSGEKELVRLEPEQAREELRAELDMPNPNVGLFRKFAACDVWILNASLTLQEGGAPPDLAPLDVAPLADLGPLEPLEPLTPVPAPAPPPPARPPGPQVPEPSSYAAQPAPAYPPPEPAQEEADLPVIELEPEPVVAMGEAAGETGDALLWAEAEPEGEWDSAEGELILEEEVQDQQAVPDTTPPQPAEAGGHEPTQQENAANMVDMNQAQGNVATAQATGSCAFCQGALPAGRVVRFCPFCGADQSMTPCPSCREPLDPSWKFCIACGHQNG